MARTLSEYLIALSTSVLENSRALSFDIWTNSMSPGSLTTLWAIQPSNRPAVFPVLAGPTNTSASISLLERELAAYGRVFRDPAGSLVVFELAPERVDTDIARRAEEQGLSLRALSPLCQDVRRNGLVLGFIYFNREVLRIAVRELKSILAGSAKDDLPGVAQ